MSPRRLWSIALLVGLALAIALMGSWSATGDPLPRVRHVLVVAVPELDLRELRDGELRGLTAGRAAIGAMSVRAKHTRPDAAEGYIALGSGVRTRSVPAASSGEVRRGRVTAIDALRAANRGRHVGSTPGALGSALRAAGRDIVVSGDGPVTLAAMDRNGRVRTARGSPRALARRHAVVIAALPGAADAARLLAAAPPADTLVMLVSVTPAAEGHLTPAAIVGRGVPRGSLVSESSRRDGIVTLGDVAPTILGALGIRRPVGMVGRPLGTRPGDPRLDRLIALDTRSDRQVDAYRPTIYLLGAALLALAAFALGGARRPAAAAALVAAALPLATYLLRLAPPAPSTALTVCLTLAIALGVAAAAAAATRDPRAALAAVLVVTAAVLAFDAATGGRLHMTTMLGYSLPGGGRFYGVPNSTFALISAAALLAAGLLVERHGRSALPAVGVAFAVIVVLSSLPGLGSDVGGLLTLIPVFGLAWLGLSGRRLGARELVWLIALALVALIAFVTIDLLRPDASRTHLGRLVAGVAENGGAQLWDAIVRKESANLRLLLSSWTPLLVVLLVVIVALRTRLQGPVRAAVLANLALAAVGFALNDSGAIVLALALFYLAPLLALCWQDDGPAADLVTGERGRAAPVPASALR